MYSKDDLIFFFLALNNLLQNHHHVMLGLFTFFVLSIFNYYPYIYHLDPKSIVKIIKMEKNETHLLLPESREPIDQSLQEEETIPLNDLNKKNISELDFHEYIVSKGDTLSTILKKYGISMVDIMKIVSVDKNLRNLKIGQQIYWTLTNNGNLKRLIWKISLSKTRNYDRINNNFKMSSDIQKGKWINRVLRGSVVGNFVSSAHDAGMTNNEIKSVIKAIQWQVDFCKLKTGDEFSVLILREIINGKSKQSQLIGVHLRSSGKDYYAIRAEDGKFYDHNGMSLAKGKIFLRFPTEKQFRISSNFNPNRLNPVTKRIVPHRGIDFAMPQGTPVLSAGDGEVAMANHSSAAGYYVVIKHSWTYTTRYMHLRKILVAKGQKVKCGDRIGLSGNTGRSTGPHLHYEVWIDKQAVNPMTAKLPNFEKGLVGKNRRKYLNQVKSILPKLYLD